MPHEGKNIMMTYFMLHFDLEGTFFYFYATLGVLKIELAVLKVFCVM